jgi:hypothetical protein
VDGKRFDSGGNKGLVVPPVSNKNRFPDKKYVLAKLAFSAGLVPDITST